MRAILTIILTLIHGDLFSQRIVTGFVTDSLGNELGGVHIVEIGTTNGTITDFNGKFEFKSNQDRFQLLISFSGFTDKQIYVQTDTSLVIILHEDKRFEYIDFYNTKLVTFGLKYDFANSVYGFVFSNGFNERPLIHFEDFSEDLIYKLNVASDFYKDYSFGLDFAWKYPFNKPILITTEYGQTSFAFKDLFYRNIGLYGLIGSKILRSGIICKISYHQLNDKKNIGATLGIEKGLIYRRLYMGISAGYFFDYFNYNLYLQGFVYKDKISLRADYQRLENYDFFKIGLNYTFRR